jgi:hypothetical protein
VLLSALSEPVFESLQECVLLLSHPLLLLLWLLQCRKFCLSLLALLPVLSSSNDSSSSSSRGVSDSTAAAAVWWF